MKKISLNLGFGNELLTKEQMKKVKGGSDYGGSCPSGSSNTKCANNSSGYVRYVNNSSCPETWFEDQCAGLDVKKEDSNCTCQA